MIERIEFPVSPVFVRNAASRARIVANQGGTSSGKTYSIMQLFTLRARRHKLKFDVIGPTVPHMKQGVIADFTTIMEKAGWWDEACYNYTDRIYRFPDAGQIQFFSADDGAKMHGPKRDYAFINELPLLEYNAWKQLLMRTRMQIFFDFNPSDFEHWIYEKVLVREDCEFIQSTFLDNLDFLPAEQIQEIERLKEEDPAFWQIYGLGERAKINGAIYEKWSKGAFPAECDEIFYGLDFGVHNPTALVKIGIKDKQYFCDELLYRTRLTNGELIEILKTVIPDKRFKIYADSAEPNRIEEIHRAGFNVQGAIKSVKDGIDFVKRHYLTITPESVNLLKEIRTYKWQEDKNGSVLDVPVKHADHALDAKRYGMYTHYMNNHAARPVLLSNASVAKRKWAGH